MQWSRQKSDLVLAVYSITLIAGLPANLLAFYTFVLKVKQNPKPIDVFLLSLNISDLIFLFFLPFRMKEAADMNWTMSYFFCSVSIVIFFTTIYNSTLLLTAISMERYLGVAFPIKYKIRRRPRNAVIASVMFWVISMVQCSVVFFIQYYTQSNSTIPEQSKQNACYAVFTREQMTILMPVRLELFLVFFCIPFIICCFCYIKFILILSRLPNINPKKRFRAIGLALGTLFVFIVCFLPYNISHLVGFLGWYSPEWRVYALLTSTFNTCLDPFIFYFSSRVLREKLNLYTQGLINRLFHSPKVPCGAQMNSSSVEEEKHHQLPLDSSQYSKSHS